VVESCECNGGLLCISSSFGLVVGGSISGKGLCFAATSVRILNSPCGGALGFGDPDNGNLGLDVARFLNPGLEMARDLNRELISLVESPLRFLGVTFISDEEAVLRFVLLVMDCPSVPVDIVSLLAAASLPSPSPSSLTSSSSISHSPDTTTSSLPSSFRKAVIPPLR